MGTLYNFLSLGVLFRSNRGNILSPFIQCIYYGWCAVCGVCSLSPASCTAFPPLTSMHASTVVYSHTSTCIGIPGGGERCRALSLHVVRVVPPHVTPPCRPLDDISSISLDTGRRYALPCDDAARTVTPRSSPSLPSPI